jgi:hypothetical protein
MSIRAWRPGSLGRAVRVRAIAIRIGTTVHPGAATTVATDRRAAKFADVL